MSISHSCMKIHFKIITWCYVKNGKLMQNRDKREDILVYIGNWNNSN